MSRMAVLNSKSGDCTSTISPPENRDLSLSSRFFISEGGLSEVKTICPPAETIELIILIFGILEIDNDNPSPFFKNY